MMQHSIDFAAGRRAIAQRDRRNAAALVIAEHLHAAERAQEAAIEANARLLTAAIEQRRELGLSATFGQDVLTLIQGANGRATEAMAGLVDSHVALEPLMGKLGLTRLGFGDGTKPGDGHEEEALRTRGRVG